MKDGVLKLATAAGDETFPGTDIAAPSFTAVRDALAARRAAADQRARLRPRRASDRPGL